MSLTFSELAGDILVPTVAVETDLASSAVSLPSLSKRLLLTGYKTSAGSAAVSTVHRVTTLKKAIGLFGIGSQLAVMFEAALRVSRSIPIYCMAVVESGGVAASGTVTLATNATGSGTLSVWVAGRLFRVGFEKDDTPTVVGDALEAAINAHPNLPVTANNTAGAVVLTARNKGLGGNTIRYRSTITPSVGMTSTDTGAVFTSGTLEGDPTAALATIEGQRFHHICSFCSDDTAFGKYKTHVAKVSSALEQQWCFASCATTAAVSDATTLTTALDDYRTQVVHLESADQPEYEIAAAFAALRCKIVNRNQTLDYLELPGITAPFAEDKWPTRADEQAALEGGVVPLRPMRNGTVVVVRNVVSRKTSPAFRDAEPMEISDYIDEDLISNAMTKFKGQALKVSSPAGTPNVLTPDRFLVFLHERMRIWDTVLDYTQGAETDIKAGRTVAEQNAQDTCRLDVGYPFRPVFGAHVIAIRKDFTTPDIV
jgi:phage tail sheath gpL-like